MTSKSKLFFLLFVFSSLFAQDTVKVSLPVLNQEIAMREQQWNKAIQEIEEARLRAAYLQGALDMLKQKRDDFLKDTIKVKN